jgi:putative flavoprotein involved in K+ transport
MHRLGTVIVGAGQAGLALSFHLTAAGHDHVLLERGRIGERWHSERWESLTLLTPNWLNRLPGSEPHADRDGFLGGRAFAAHLRGYARSFGAPVAEGAAVTRVARARDGFAVETTAGALRAANVVVATGDSDFPALPAIAGSIPAAVLQLHSSRYRAPDALPPGGVIVVGAGPSGQQIARELARAGRDVVLAVGRHARVPRRYRGRDIFDWLHATGQLDQRIDEMPDPVAARRAPSLPLTGGRGGERLDLAALAAEGVVVAGRLVSLAGGRAGFADDLHANVAAAEARMHGLLARIDRHVAQLPGAHAVPAAEPIAPVTLPEGPAALDLRAAGVATVIWATGYRRRRPWLHAAPVGEDGELLHTRGVTPQPGLYALGLRFQHRRSSHQIGGVGADAAYLASRIA